MDSLNVLAPNYTVGIVSCDIVGHSSATAQNQLSRVAAINEIVARTIESGPAGKVVWASGGDGGHVLFLQEYWQQPAVNLILTLRQWTYSEGVLLRIIGHYGVVAPVQGADGRVQMVGEAINYAARLLTQAPHKKGVVVSEVFRREIVSTTVEPAIEISRASVHPPPAFPVPATAPNVHPVCAVRVGRSPARRPCRA
jgi:hypothetical protein